jgi:hypothetical protein
MCGRGTHPEKAIGAGIAPAPCGCGDRIGASLAISPRLRGAYFLEIVPVVVSGCIPASQEVGECVEGMH